MAVTYNTQQKVRYYQTSTTNKSFLEMARYMRDIGIKNYQWPLILFDPDLARIDPFDPKLPQIYKVKVLRECIYNPIYFIRECVRIESSTPGGVPFGLHRGNMAIIYMMLMNINCFIDLPRQTGKTIGVLTVLLYWYQFGINNTEFNFLHKKLDGATDNLDDLRKMRDLLPPYLRMSQVEDNKGKKIKEKSNVRDLQHPVNGNRIRTVASARNKVAAASQMRGRTSPIIYYDEFAFSPYNMIVYTNMVPAYNTAANNCKMVGAPYGIYMTTTPGLLTTDEGKAANDFRNSATPFQERWYDLTKEQINEVIAANNYSNFVYIRFTYQQVGKSEEWFKELCKNMQKDWTSIRREVLLEWSDVNDECPFNKEDLDTIKTMLRQPINTFLIFNKYPFKIYEQMDSMRSIPILGIDVSAGLSRDSSAIVVIDSRTSKVTATFECNYISTIEFAAVIQEIVSRYMPRAVINIERNGGFGTSVIAKLVKSNIKKNLFFSIKDRVIEEQVITGVVHRTTQKVKVYGFDSSKNNRAELFDLVNDRVEYHKDKVIEPRIHEELCALRMDPKGRIDHPVGGHDDLVIAWALALYVLYRGGDIANDFGITRHMIKTDADVDEEIYDINKDAEVIDTTVSVVDSQAQVDDQLKFMESAPGKMSYEEWMKSEFEKEKLATEKILASKTGREGYIRKFNLDSSSVEGDPYFTVPNQVFTDFYSDSNQMQQQQGVGCGNLFSKFAKIMSVR